MVRACVAFACGSGEVSSRSLNKATETSRRPSSFASISPEGPPPTINAVNPSPIFPEKEAELG